MSQWGTANNAWEMPAAETGAKNQTRQTNGWDKQQPATGWDQSVSKTAAKLKETNLNDDSKAMDEEPRGLDPYDYKAEVELQDGAGTVYKAAKTFQELGLSEPLLKGVYAMGFNEPSKIQGEALPRILAKDNAGKYRRINLIGQAHHGSGKTATYTLSMLSLVDEKEQYPQALCVVPTRELAIQVHSVVQKLAKFTTITAFCAVQGSKRATQATEQIVIGTPGTVLAKIKHREFDPKKIRILVLDEADEMLKADGHVENSKKIKLAVDRSVQVLLFSATFSPKVQNFAEFYAGGTDKQCIKLKVKKEQLSLENIKPFYIKFADINAKYKMLLDIYALLEIGSSIIFVHTVAMAKELCNKMRADNFAVSLLHGKDMDMAERDRVMQDFREGKTNVLISTNLISRGIDVLQVNVVINFEMPLKRDKSADPETYIHRVGRAGRFGRKGVALNFIDGNIGLAAVAYLSEFFKCPIVELPCDLEKITEEVKKVLEE